MKGKKLSTNGKTKLHIHGNNLTPTEAEQIKKHFGTAEVKWIPGGHQNDIKKALHDAVTNGVLLLQRGMHFMAVLSVNNHEWFTFEKQGGQIVICRKTPGSHELPEVARFATIASPAST